MLDHGWTWKCLPQGAIPDGDIGATAAHLLTQPGVGGPPWATSLLPLTSDKLSARPCKLVLLQHHDGHVNWDLLCEVLDGRTENMPHFNRL